MQAIILAAGMGKRLKELTRENTKCMVKVNGVPLIDRMLRQIEKRHLSRIVIVVGYEGQKLMDHISTLHIQTPIVYIENPIYDKTNNIYSLALAKDWLCREDTLLFESDLIFEDAVLDALVDNPSGNYIKKADLLRLAAWTAEREIRLVVDESFADFADEENNTLIEQEILDASPWLYVIKSISKSYGVPGLRLGVLASGDTGMIDYMKRDAAIWNINSFAEFYLQIGEKYKKDYMESLVRIRKERARFEEELSRIEGLRVIPSQANYVMVQLAESISSKELLKTLLCKHDILIKELTAKTDGRNLLRLAVRNTKENNVLLEALRGYLQQSHLLGERVKNEIL